MKNYLTLAIAAVLGLSTLITNAQEEMQYLFGGPEKNVKVSGFGGVFNEFSSVDKDFAFSMGGGAALLLNHKYYFGAYGMGLTTRHIKEYDTYISGEGLESTGDLYTRFGQGGLWLGYIHNPKSAFHWGVDAKIGWGAVTLSEMNDTFTEYKWNYYDSDNVFVFTPEVKLGINLLKWMRADVGVGYRLVSGVNNTYTTLDDNGNKVNKEYFDRNAFNSVTGEITLAFGWF